MSDFITSYSNLLIYQFANKPKAKAHIQTLLKELKRVYEAFNELNECFDLDLAVGKQQDILGKIVGVSRNTTFKTKNEAGEIEYKNIKLSDDEYRLFLKAKIIKNSAKAIMVDEIDRLSLQDAISFLFDSKAYIIDRKDMTMSIYIDYSYSIDFIRLIKELDLIPRPQGVDYYFYYYSADSSFGFCDNPNSGGFGELDDPLAGAPFAEIIDI